MMLIEMKQISKQLMMMEKQLGELIVDAKQAGQCLAAWLSYGELTTGNFLYPMILGMLLPAGVNTLTVVMEVRGM